MNISVPRKVWTLPELGQRWKVSQLDIRRAIIDGILRPCVMLLDAKLTPVVCVDGVATLVPDAQMEPVSGYVYPVFAQQVQAFNYRFQILCDMAQPVEGCRLWSLPEPLMLDWVIDHGVVPAEDVTEAEAALKPVPSESSLTTKETNSLSIIVATLWFEKYGWYGDNENSSIPEFRRAAEAIGRPISYNTVKRHLEECWARAEPVLGEPATHG